VTVPLTPGQHAAQLRALIERHASSVMHNRYSDHLDALLALLADAEQRAVEASRHAPPRVLEWVRMVQRAEAAEARVAELEAWAADAAELLRPDVEHACDEDGCESFSCKSRVLRVLLARLDEVLT
jgi:hypothetical protein